MKKPMIVAAVIAASVAANNAQAASITQTFNTNTFFPIDSPAQFFDSNLGTLTSVTFGNNFRVSGSYSLTNTSASTVTGDIGIGGTTIAMDNGFLAKDNAINLALQKAIGSFAGYTTSSSYTLASGATFSAGFDSGQRAGTFTDTAATDLTAFSQSGGGLFALTAFLPFSTAVRQPTGTYQANTVAVGSGNFTLTYNYSVASIAAAAPEPAAWAMMIFGFGIAGAALRRKKTANVNFKFA